MDILDCMTAGQNKSATIDDEHPSILSEYVLHGWPSMRAKVEKVLQQYWSFRDGVITDGIAMQGKRIIISAILHGNVLQPAAHKSHWHRED